MLLFFWGCFAPSEGDWAFYEVSQSGDCSIDQGSTFEESINISIDGNGFSLEYTQTSLSCSLQGKDFTCASSTVDVDRSEVQLRATIAASGSFDNSYEGALLLVEDWSCTSGDCTTYDLDACTLEKEGSLVRIE